MSESRPEPSEAQAGVSDGWYADLNGRLGGDSDGADAIRGGDGSMDLHVESQRRSLSSIIEAEIVPRLVLARRAVTAAAAAPIQPRTIVRPADIYAFSRVVLRHEAQAAAAQLEQFRRKGLSVETIYLDLLAPVARRLGDLWEQDLCDFTDVTLGMGRLQQVMREYEPLFHEEVASTDLGRRILLVAAPGEQHSFGLSLVVEFFRRAGWDTRVAPQASLDDLVSLVRSQWFAVVGMSTGSSVRLDPLAVAIRALRRASRNRSVGVLVGGAVFVQNPELVTLVGADATAVDARQATIQAQDLVRLLQRSP